MAKMTTLDQELGSWVAQVILLVDVEGCEPNVLEGGQDVIAKKRPVVIFEYNSISKAPFSISDICGSLDEHYRIYRLRQDGRVGFSVDNAWNCVGAPRPSFFSNILEAMCAG